MSKHCNLANEDPPNKTHPHILRKAAPFGSGFSSFCMRLPSHKPNNKSKASKAAGIFGSWL